MKTREVMATMWLGLVIVAVTLGLVSVGVLYDNQQLRQEGRELRAELDALTTESTGLKSERDLIDEELRAERRRVEDLSVQLAELKPRAESKEPVARQQAYRIRAFLENRELSQGWLLPGRATTNASGQLVYEPVVVLDPSARAALTAGTARQQSAAQPSVVTINHNYPSSHGGVWPVYGVWYGGHRPGRPDPKPDEPSRFPIPPRPQPQPVSPFLSAGIWQPGNGWQQMPRGRPGGEWVSSSPRGISYLSSGAGTGATGGGASMPIRY